jgi:transposase
MRVNGIKSHIKKEPAYKERKEAEREEFKEMINQFKSDSIVYIDESGIDEYCHRTYARARIGRKVYGEIPGRKFERTNILAGLKAGKILEPLEYSGTTDSALFEFWLENRLLPTLDKGSVIVLDNASFHRKSTLFDIVERMECTLIYLPPYSPDLNPIEHVWANMKNFLRNYMGNFGSLSEALSDYFQFK